MRTQRIVDKNRKDGSTLLSVMAILVLVTFAGASVISYAAYQVYSIDGMRDSIKAKAIAEAGVNHAYSIVKEDWSAVSDPSQFPATSLGGGTYDATVTAVGSSKAVISAVGTFGASTVEVVADVQNFQDASPTADPTSPWAYTIFADDDITHNGSSTVLGGVHCNDAITANGSSTWGSPINVQAVNRIRINGGSSVWDGTATAPKLQGSGISGITTPVVDTVASIPFPVVDLTDYYNTAAANSQVYGPGTYSGNLGTIPGGVRWHNGNITLSSVTFEGCIIATGSITLSGGVNHTRVGGLPSLMSRDSYIRFNGSRDIEGLLYAGGGYIRFNGAGTLTGSVVANGDIIFNGNSGVFTYQYSEPGDANDPVGTPEEEVAITAWQK